MEAAAYFRFSEKQMLVFDFVIVALALGVLGTGIGNILWERRRVVVAAVCPAQGNSDSDGTHDRIAGGDRDPHPPQPIRARGTAHRVPGHRGAARVFCPPGDRVVLTPFAYEIWRHQIRTADLGAFGKQAMAWFDRARGPKPWEA